MNSIGDYDGQGNNDVMCAHQGYGGRGNTECTYMSTNEEGTDETIAGTDGVTHRNVTCFGCQFQGHYRNQ